jgi:hypothetical protein
MPGHVVVPSQVNWPGQVMMSTHVAEATQVWNPSQVAV